MIRRCFLCENSNWQLIYQLKTKAVYRCRRCGRFISPPDNQYHYDDQYYRNSPYPDNQKLNQPYFLHKLNQIKSSTGKKKLVILDVGCGWGEFLAVLKQRQINYLGIDTAAEAIKTCRAKGLNCRQADAGALARSQPHHYSAVTCFQVIEHLPDPFPLLKAVKTLLKPGGKLILTTPNNDSPLRKVLGRRWSVYNTDSHFVFYNKKTIRLLLTKAGFRRIQVKIDRPRFLSLEYIISRLTGRQWRFGRQIPCPTDPWGDLAAVASTAQKLP